ncbi:hypothetical protein BGY98DRAFT_991095 [Russula aff. rugulosa BPL654]|nr:hypothetical protein BGY98DRAFT_991095 [Russula aff. rugulosa BPL654]
MLIRGVSALSGRALTKFRAEPMSGSSRQVNLPLQSASRPKVLSALDMYLSTTYFRPDEDGVIDLTTDENDALSEVVGAQLMGCHPSVRVPDDRRATSTARVENRRLKKTDSLKENEDTTKQGQSLTSRSTKYPSTLASRPASTNYQSSGVVTKPPMEQQEPAYPPYNYADHIPKPKVIYIRDEGRANEMNWGAKEGKVALVQLCDADIILLIHVSKMKRFPENVKELIESSKVPSPVGLRTCKQIKDDGMKLFRDYGILASNLVELGALACQVDKSFASTFKRPIVSLAKVVSYFLQKTLDKDLKDLTREQMKYASNDVHSGLIVYKFLMKTAHSSTTQLTPERYTADLAGELRGRGDNDLPVICRTSHHKKAQRFERRRATSPTGIHTLAPGPGLLDICIRMRDPANPQSETVVISYILRALSEDPTLSFSLEDLISLVRLDSSSWNYHRDTIERWAQEGRQP